MVTHTQPAIQQKPRPISFWCQWLERPQRLWIRRALFQVHLWTGIGIGLYVFVISVSGSAAVYRRDINRKYGTRIVTVLPAGQLSINELKKRAQAVFPQAEVEDLYLSRRKTGPALVYFAQGDRRFDRFFDPYTGKDLGPTLLPVQQAIEFVTDLHDNLLLGTTGRTINGIGAIFTTVLSLTGLFIWWPGVKNWWRALKIKWGARFPQFNWDLHSAVGFWCSLFILLWGVSGIYFSFPGLFTVLSDRDTTWLSRLHFGRMNWMTEIVWAVLGLAPAALFVTGALMWWNRKLRKYFRATNESSIQQKPEQLSARIRTDATSL